MRAMHRLVLLVALLGWTHLPLCCGLKSLASQSESKHKVRDTVEAAIRGFEAQLAAGNLDEFSGEYALARALVERGTHAVTDFVIDEMFPRSNAPCSWDWASLQCQPCGQCRRAYFSELASSGSNASSWCRALAPDERVSGQLCADSTLSVAREGMVVGLTSGRLGKRLHHAVLKFVEQELVAPSNSSCHFGVLQMRCEPSALCTMAYQKGDFTPGQACRLIEGELAPMSTSSCSWNRAQFRCEQAGACRLEVWPWMRRGLQRRAQIVLRLSRNLSHMLYEASISALHTTAEIFTDKVRDAASFWRVVLMSLHEDLLLTLHRSGRGMKHYLLRMQTAINSAPSKQVVRSKLRGALDTCNIWIDFWNSRVFAPTKRYAATVRKELPMCCSRLVHSIKSWDWTAAAQAWLESSKRRVRSTRDMLSGCTWAKIDSAAVRAKERLRDTAVAVLTMSWHRAVQIGANTYNARMRSFRAARTCPHEYALKYVSPLSTDTVDSVVRALDDARKWIVQASFASWRAAILLKEALVRMCHYGIEGLERIEAELDSTPQHRKVDLCVAIPREEQKPAQSWKFYSAWSAKKTASIIHQRIVRQLMV